MENLLEQEQLMGQDLLSSDSVTYKIFRDLLDTIYVLMNVDVDARANNTQFRKLKSFYKLNNFESNSQMIANTKEFEESLLRYFGSLSHTHFKIIEDQAGSIYEEETVKISMSIHFVLSYYESKIQKQFNVAKKEDDLIIDEFVKNNSDSEK